ncbi:MAG: hypothetical protein ACI95C_002546 [Pseudohongiellaceae bacterium]|jgi:hypothetical protein
MTKTTTEKTASKVESNTDAKYSLDSYFETMTKNTEKMAEGFTAMRERNTRIMNQFVESVTSGQKDFIDLSRAVSAQPADYKANMQLLLDTLNRRQACALELGKTVYREQADMSSVVTERMEQLFEPMKALGLDWTAPYKKMADYWAPSAK